MVALALATAPLAAQKAHANAVEVTAKEFLSGAVDHMDVEMEATVSDALSDETDPQYVFLVLEADGETIYAPVKCGNESISSAERLVGARIRVKGLCDAYVPKPRRQLGRQLFIASLSDIEVLRPAPADHFDVPELGDTRLMTPSEIARLDRRRTVGRILASWANSESLLETPSGRLVRVSFANRQAPESGTFAEVVGRPVSDVYRVNLERARWRLAPSFGISAIAATNVTARDIMMGADGHIQVKPQFLGKTIVLRGTLRSRNGDTLNVEDGPFIVPVVVAGAYADVEPGSLVEATGTCVLDVENWRPNAAFPQIRGFFIVTHGADDIKVLSRPPWWTAERLLTVIALLVAAIGGVLFWNAALRRIVERRSRELIKAQMSELKSSLKVGERTRLAAELHDSLAQTLTGVAMEIDAARKRMPDGTCSDARRHLDFASNAIDASREELRNCIWDLRGKTLDEPDMDKAVWYALMPHLGEAALHCRFLVPRSRLSDAIAHAALRIVRELATNAVRHGRAKNVRVAGCIDGNALRFSVEDDGCGFSPKSAPGIDHGHFGLQGIQERVGAFDGSFSIESTPGVGTRAEATLPLDGGKEES